MKCPVCNNENRIEIHMHTEGYSDTLLECFECGALWLNEFDEIVLLNKKAA